MPKLIPFVKGQAYGNDFLLVPEADVEGRDLTALARAMCSRHEGIGADGLMLHTFGPTAIRMRLFNADGSASEVSGNGIRCLAALAVRREAWPVACHDRHARRRESTRAAGSETAKR